MKRDTQRPILWVAIFILSIAWLALGAFALSLAARTPLAEPMTLSKGNLPAPTSLSTPISTPITTPISTPIPTIVSAATVEAPSPVPVEAKTVNISSKPAETCGNSGSLTVLFTGEDFSKGEWPLGADAVRVAKFDFSGKKITIVAFPRDLWVKTPGLADQNIPETTLGLSYYYKKQSTNGAEKHKVTAATEMVAQALYDNFGLAPRNYFTIQLESIGEMIDTIGGVDINVPESITTENGEVISAGQQTMNGHTAIEYVRTSVQGDAARLERQNLFLKALQSKAASANLLASVPDLYKQFDKAIVTDLSPKQIYDLACLANAASQDQISFYAIGGDLVIERSDGTLDPQVDLIKAKLKAWLGE